MTPDEFNKLIPELFAAYPNLESWLEERRPDAEDRRKTLATWFRTLAKVEFADAMAALGEWLDGACPLKAYERDLVAVLLKNTADRIASKRFRPEQAILTQATRTDAPRRNLVSLAALLAEGRLVGKQFVNGEITQEQFDAEKQRLVDLAKLNAEEDQAYRCLHCFDTGRVQVWHPDAVAAIERGERTVQTVHTTAITACTCSRGDDVKNVDKCRVRLARYSNSFCKCDNHMPSTADRQRLRDHVESGWQKNKHKEFSAWEQHQTKA